MTVISWGIVEVGLIACPDGLLVKHSDHVALV